MTTHASLRRASVLVVVAVLVSGCGGDAGGEDPGATPPPVTVTETVTEAAQGEPADEQTGAGPVETTEAGSPSHSDPAARAAQAALLAEPDGAVLSLDPEGGDVWEVLVRRADGSGVEIYVNSETGQTMRDRSARVPAAARDAAPQLTAVEAIDVVLETISDGVIRELDIDTERGRVVWEVLVQGGAGATEFYIDAGNGDIVKQEPADW